MEAKVSGIIQISQKFNKEVYSFAKAKGYALLPEYPRSSCANNQKNVCVAIVGRNMVTTPLHHPVVEHSSHSNAFKNKLVIEYM